MRQQVEQIAKEGLYHPSFEHDNCGIGAVVDIKGRASHKIVDDALKIVENLEHRAGKDAVGETGDGVGILTQVPHGFFQRECGKLGISLGEKREYGVGMFFFPQEELQRSQAKKMFEIIVEKEGLQFLGWRDVPVHPEVLGEKARSCMPFIAQGFIRKPDHIPAGLAFDRKLYVVRRVFEQSNANTYVSSLSGRTMVYKGMFLVGQLRTFFEDLQDEAYASAIAMVHSRFSTNTNPSWERAHPNRLIVHNGEINTIRGNADKMLAREETLESSRLSLDDFTKVLPVVNTSGSDSAMLDNTLEFLMMSGMDLPLAAMVMIDAIGRLIPGVLGNEESAGEESFYNDLLEYPQYSRPEQWQGMRVPEVLLSGNHRLVSAWRLEQSRQRTARRRPDLYARYQEKQRLTERLSRQKRDNIHMMESLSRGRADILYTDFRGQDTAVLLYDRCCAIAMMTALDGETGERMADLLPGDTQMILVSEAFMRDLLAERGYAVFGEFGQVLYTRKEALPSLRSSVITVVTEVGAAQVWCQRSMGEIFISRLSSTHSSPKWQNRTTVSRLARSAR